MVHLKPLKLDASKTMDEYAKRLATLTPGFSGADIHNLCNEAAILAARNNKEAVSTKEFEVAAERVLAGLEKKKVMSEEERKVVAFHESGHAVVSWFLEGGHPLLKLTIIPRSKGSLGFAQYLPSETSLETKEELLDRICCILGGRCSEEHFFGRITTGAYDDLRKVYDIAHALVTKFGMSDTVGFIGFSEDESGKRYSEDTNKIIDQEIKKIVDLCTVRTREVIQKHKGDIEKLAKTLLEKETLDLQAIVNILGERPFAPKSNFKAYLDIKKQDEAEKQAAEQVSNDSDQTPPTSPPTTA
jgi:AFG3 family protein